MADKQHGVYPTDEFDNPSQGPVGLHRGPRGFGARALPYLVVLIVAAACGLGVFMWLSHGSASSDSSASSSVSESASSSSAKKTASASASASSASASPSETSTQTATSTPTPSATETTATPSATVNKSSSITVYNGTRQSGLASTKATTLRNAGYASVAAKNPSDRNSLPSASTVWYRSSDDLATARDVASQLGISQVMQVDGLGTDVAVVLMQ